MSEMLTVPLHDIAHGRSGDKGNRLNISVIAYRPEAWPILVREVTEARVLAMFAHRGASRVTRYVLENIQALNFVIDDALEGRRQFGAQPRHAWQDHRVPSAVDGRDRTRRTCR